MVRKCFAIICALPQIRTGISIVAKLVNDGVTIFREARLIIME